MNISPDEKVVVCPSFPRVLRHRVVGAHPQSYTALRSRDASTLAKGETEKRGTGIAIGESWETLSLR